VGIDVISALGSVLGGLGAIAAVFIAVFAIRRQEAANTRALNAQAQATREAREHERRLLLEERMWNRRVDLYARISLAMRRYVEQPPTGPDGKPVTAADVAELADLVSEADMVASKSLADLLEQFMYDNADSDTQLELWNTFQHDARAELMVDRLHRPPILDARAALEGPLLDLQPPDP
jgi:hypothetical protein